MITRSFYRWPFATSAKKRIPFDSRGVSAEDEGGTTRATRPAGRIADNLHDASLSRADAAPQISSGDLLLCTFHVACLLRARQAVEPCATSQRQPLPDQHHGTPAEEIADARVEPTRGLDERTRGGARRETRLRLHDGRGPPVDRVSMGYRHRRGPAWNSRGRSLSGAATVATRAAPPRHRGDAYAGAAAATRSRPRSEPRPAFLTS